MPNSLAKDRDSDRSSILRSLLRDKSSQSIVQIFQVILKIDCFPFHQGKTERFDTARAHTQKQSSRKAQRRLNFYANKLGMCQLNAKQSFRVNKQLMRAL